jgi:5-methylcytosine-specific restriction endonuclease McrA
MSGQKRPKEHITKQKEVKQRDGCECEICGCTATNRYGNPTAHGHHIIPYKDNGPADLLNMMTLCPECHRKYHSGKIKVDIWRF